MEQDNLQDINEKLDIISLASSYGVEFKKSSGARYRAKINPFRDEDTSSVDFFSDSNRYFDRGDSSIKGDAIDLIAFFEKCTNAEAIQKAKEMVGSANYTVTKREITSTTKTKEKKPVNFSQLANQAQSELSASLPFLPKVIEVDYASNNGFVDKSKSTEQIYIFEHFHKLFETSHFELQFYKKLHYVSKNLLGFSSFWNCPSIILKDRKEKVVDVVAYRPKDKETKQEIKGMKYYYKNFDQRGDDFVYPFENLVNLVAKRQKYIIIGEGLKNALNALIYDVPFISIESTGNAQKLDQKLIDAINAFIEKGYGVVCGFDGDESGRKAYESFLLLTGLTCDNLFEWDSGIDFVEYLRGSK